MGVDYSQFKWAKNGGKLRVEVTREKRLTNEEKERNCRAEVWRLYGHKCHVPGCREKGQQHHLIYRSQSRRLKSLSCTWRSRIRSLREAPDRLTRLRNVIQSNE